MAMWLPEHRPHRTDDSNDRGPHHCLTLGVVIGDAAGPWSEISVQMGQLSGDAARPRKRIRTCAERPGGSHGTALTSAFICRAQQHFRPSPR